MLGVCHIRHIRSLAGAVYWRWVQKQRSCTINMGYTVSPNKPEKNCGIFAIAVVRSLNWHKDRLYTILFTHRPFIFFLLFSLRFVRSYSRLFCFCWFFFCIQFQLLAGNNNNNNDWRRNVCSAFAGSRDVWELYHTIISVIINRYFSSHFCCCCCLFSSCMTFNAILLGNSSITFVRK